MSLRDHINFTAILDDSELIDVECGDVFKSVNRSNEYCDEKVDKKSCKTYNKFLSMVSGQKFKKINRQYLQKCIDKDSEYDVKSLRETYYKSDEGMFLYKFELEMCFDCICLGVWNPETNQYVAIGARCGHPFIITDDFSYNNSDGSGPDITFKGSANSTIATIIKYFNQFSTNSYH